MLAGVAGPSLFAPRSAKCRTRTPQRPDAALHVNPICLSTARPRKPYGQRLQHFEMVVGLADQKLDRFAGSPHCGGEVARLPLEFRSLVSAVAENEWRRELVEMPDGGQRRAPSRR